MCVHVPCTCVYMHVQEPMRAQGSEEHPTTHTVKLSIFVNVIIDCACAFPAAFCFRFKASGVTLEGNNHAPLKALATWFCLLRQATQRLDS